MHRGLADAEPLGRAAHRRLVLYDVERQLAGALLDVPFHTATLPRICSLGGCICAGRGGYEKLRRGLIPSAAAFLRGYGSGTAIGAYTLNRNRTMSPSSPTQLRSAGAPDFNSARAE